MGKSKTRDSGLSKKDMWRKINKDQKKQRKMRGRESNIQKLLKLEKMLQQDETARVCYSSPRSTRFFPWRVMPDNVCKAHTLEIFMCVPEKKIASWELVIPE